MNSLINRINLLKKEIGYKVEKRIKEFENISDEDKFNELCFCLMTANFNAERSILIQNKLNDSFAKLCEKELALKLKELGHRFPNARAKYITEARKHNIKENREWLANNVKGLGLKEASHFLRNIGYKNYAIIDFHIIDILIKHKLIEKPKTLTKNKYYEIENVLKKLAAKLNLDLARLDLYLWYLETGKILK